VRASALTRRESEVFRLVVTGRLNKQIAATLGTTEKTIKVHRARVMAKMHAESIPDLVRMFDMLADQPATAPRPQTRRTRRALLQQGELELERSVDREVSRNS